MKIAFLITMLVAGLVVYFGSPIAGELPATGHYYDAPKAILPMNFAHLDHAAVNCVHCHHNYVDDAGGGLCMNCHVTNPQVWPLLQNQFHDLCRGCHEDQAAMGEDGGPPRRCISCHTGDDLP